MTYMAILILMLAAFSMVGWPLVSPSRRARAEASDDSPWDDLIGQRDIAYRAIQELDFEHQLGNLSEADYQDLRERYRAQAAAILQKLETSMGSADESETPSGGPADAATAAPAAPDSGALPCPSCGQSTKASDRYCWRCGAPQGRRCPSCDRPVEDEGRFCAGCGAQLEAQS